MPGRAARLGGAVEVDEAHWGGEESGVRGRQSVDTRDSDGGPGVLEIPVIPIHAVPGRQIGRPVGRWHYNCYNYAVLPLPTLSSTRTRAAGFSLIECMAAAAVLLIGIGSIMTLNQNQFRILKSTQQVTSGTLCMQERVEAMRIATWRQLTDSSYLANTLVATPPKSSAALAGLQEQITVSAYPDPSAATSLVVKKVSGQSAAILPAGSFASNGFRSTKPSALLMNALVLPSTRSSIKNTNRSHSSAAIRRIPC
jgi:Tfp pilus assembly protein PilV